MWYIKLLHHYLGKKVPKNENQALLRDMNSTFKHITKLHSNLKLEIILHVVSFIKKAYHNVPLHSISLAEVNNDLKMAILLASKTCEDHAVYASDFVPQFGSLDYLLRNERLFLKDKLNYEVDFNLKDLFSLFKHGHDILAVA